MLLHSGPSNPSVTFTYRGAIVVIRTITVPQLFFSKPLLLVTLLWLMVCPDPKHLVTSLFSASFLWFCSKWDRMNGFDYNRQTPHWLPGGPGFQLIYHTEERVSFLNQLSGSFRCVLMHCEGILLNLYLFHPYKPIRKGKGYILEWKIKRGQPGMLVLSPYGLSCA